MEWKQLIIDGYERVSGMLGEYLKGLAVEDLDTQPKPDCNSIGWLAWHLTRVQDDHIADLMGDSQLWIKNGWHARFNRQPDPKDIGFGHSDEDVKAFKSPDIEIILNYHKAVLERTKNYIGTLSEGDLDRVLNEPWFQPLPTVGVRLVSILCDELQHAGQIAYIRGLLRGKGWLGY